MCYSRPTWESSSPSPHARRTACRSTKRRASRRKLSSRSSTDSRRSIAGAVASTHPRRVRQSHPHAPPGSVTGAVRIRNGGLAVRMSTPPLVAKHDAERRVAWVGYRRMSGLSVQPLVATAPWFFLRSNPYCLRELQGSSYGSRFSPPRLTDRLPTLRAPSCPDWDRPQLEPRDPAFLLAHPGPIQRPRRPTSVCGMRSGRACAGVLLPPDPPRSQRRGKPGSGGGIKTTQRGLRVLLPRSPSSPPQRVGSDVANTKRARGRERLHREAHSSGFPILARRGVNTPNPYNRTRGVIFSISLSGPPIRSIMQTGNPMDTILALPL